MIVKQRTEPVELVLLTYLEKRLDSFSSDQLGNLEKGYRGELMWDSLIVDRLPSSSYLMMNDLLLTCSGGQMFQIDTLLLRKKFIIFEVKNYDGDFLVENDKWYTVSTKTEIHSPLIQLQRTETAFRRLLKDLNINIPVEAYLVLVNPEFTLFHAPFHSSILLSSQLKRFLQKLNQDHYITTNQDRSIAEKIVSCHIEKSPYVRLPSYCYDELSKGIPCISCGRLLCHLNHSYLQCICGEKESVDAATLRNITEFQTLFPDKQLTTAGIYDWCGGVLSEKTVRRILKKNFHSQSSKRHTYYI